MSKGGMGNLMKQAQMMQVNLKKAQDELANINIEGSSGNGLVKITMSCKNDVKKIDIDSTLLDDKEMLEDLIIVALKDAFQKIEITSSEKMNGLVPPGMNLPF
ncbi:YbaB/EbfC family nucleoid-associated protein [Methylophilaceae bacterium]|jgi:nucleoid-associated protein EbfC|nr:YbaB/EbfC family nucleoid-associated protein [Methylophilaceae bacterium]|tara:strand:+ start:136 stop:444 length:309 start_codon:yes stop_codon:yes gene_type:complete